MDFFPKISWTWKVLENEFDDVIGTVMYEQLAGSQMALME